MGWGRLLLDPAKQHDDIRMIGMAIKKRWDISDDFRTIIVDRLRAVIQFTDDDEIAIKAIAKVRALESQNQKDEHKDLDEFSNRVLELANRLGIATGDGGAIAEAGIGAGRSDGVSEDSSQDQD